MAAIAEPVAETTRSVAKNAHPSIEKELAGKAARFLKAEMKRAGVTYAELAKRLEARGLKETEASIANKFSRGTIAATLLIASLAALELEGFSLSDL